MLIKARFLDEEKNPKGREYTYVCDSASTVGEIAYTAEGKELVITAIDLMEAAGMQWGDRLKSLTLIPPEVNAPSLEPALIPTQVADQALMVSVEDVIVVERLPLISEKMKELSREIDGRISAVIAMECTLETKATIKRHRAELNTIFKNLEARRIAVEKQILAPYDAFKMVYKDCVTDKFKAAFGTLDSRTGEIDEGLKNELREDVKSYFAEYALCEGVEWLTFEQSGIKVGLSDKKTALRRLAKEFIDRVVGDIAMIDTQAEKAEILVEYHKSLNAASAIKVVKDRAVAVENEKQRQLALAEARAAEGKRKQEMAAMAPAPISAPTPVVPPAVAIEPASEPSYNVAFKVTAPRGKIAALSQYLKDNDIAYKQIPLKNIKEAE